MTAPATAPPAPVPLPPPPIARRMVSRPPMQSPPERPPTRHGPGSTEGPVPPDGTGSGGGDDGQLRDMMVPTSLSRKPVVAPTRGPPPGTHPDDDETPLTGLAPPPPPQALRMSIGSGWHRTRELSPISERSSKSKDDDDTDDHEDEQQQPPPPLPSKDPARMTQWPMLVPGPEHKTPPPRIVINRADSDLSDALNTPLSPESYLTPDSMPAVTAPSTTSPARRLSIRSLRAFVHHARQPPPPVSPTSPETYYASSSGTLPIMLAIDQAHSTRRPGGSIGRGGGGSKRKSIWERLEGWWDIAELWNRRGGTGTLAGKKVRLADPERQQHAGGVY